MTELIWALRGFEGLSLLVGSVIALQSFRAFRRTGQSSLLLLGLGFLLISLAAGLAGVIYELLTHDLLAAWTASVAFDSFGFLVILYSILVRERATVPNA